MSFKIFIIIAIASILPDIDYPYSPVGKYLYLFYIPFELLTSLKGHRGFTHTFPAMFLLSFPVFIYAKDCYFFFLYGYASHIFLDLLNPTGVSLLFPYKKNKISLNLFKVGEFEELAIFFICLQYILLRF